MKNIFRITSCSVAIIYIVIISGCSKKHFDQSSYTVKDSIIYVYDTVYIHHYIDTVYSHSSPTNSNSPKHVKSQKGILQLNPDNFGIGPSFGAYYSPFNGFDILFGFGVQYFFTKLPFGKTKTKHPGFHRNIHHHK